MSKQKRLRWMKRDLKWMHVRLLRLVHDNTETERRFDALYKAVEIMAADLERVRRR